MNVLGGEGGIRTRDTEELAINMIKPNLLLPTGILAQNHFLMKNVKSAASASRGLGRRRRKPFEFS
jgi:hypothetical protein